MKILYAFQATGNGHYSRAKEIVPVLQEIASLDVLVSGPEKFNKYEIQVDYRLNGLGFFFGKKGGIDYGLSLRRIKPITLLREIFSMKVEDYDLVINDFEPITAWACQIK